MSQRRRALGPRITRHHVRRAAAGRRRFAIEDKSRTQVTVLNDCPPPSARVSASFVPHIAPVSAAPNQGGAPTLRAAQSEPWAHLVALACAARAHTQKVNDILLFGGEYTELTSGKVRVYNDLYVFHADKQRWTQVVSPNGCAS